MNDNTHHVCNPYYAVELLSDPLCSLGNHTSTQKFQSGQKEENGKGISYRV